MAKGTTKKPKESKCRGSGAPLEGRDWVRIGGSKWLREVAEKQGKYIPKEYKERSGAEIEKERSARAAASEQQRSSIPPQQQQEDDENLGDNIPDAEAPLEEPEGTFHDE